MTDEIDNTDKRILAYLITYQRATSSSDEIILAGFTKIKTKLEAKGLKTLSVREHKEYNIAKFQTMMLIERLDTSEPIPKSIEDISSACKSLNLKDLELRLSKLETLEMIEKIPNGIAISKKYRKIK
jgi:hypothetical protein